MIGVSKGHGGLQGDANLPLKYALERWNNSIECYLEIGISIRNHFNLILDALQRGNPSCKIRYATCLYLWTTMCRVVPALLTTYNHYLITFPFSKKREDKNRQIT